VLVLALDTSSAAVSAALVEVSDARPTTRAEHSTLNARGHGEYLAPMIAACLADAGARPADLGAIVVGTGPGPFTGLRVGLVTAAVMAEALGIPAYAVCSLDGIAPPHEGTLLVAGDARRHEVYWARYLDDARIEGPHVSRPADVVIGDASAMAGAGARLYEHQIGLPLLDADFPAPGALVTRALDRIRSGAHSDPLTPRYLRRPDAVEPAHAKQATQPKQATP
jgi:tRNA threonylcarbamoyl adenosine modification protein YeaZ